MIERGTVAEMRAWSRAARRAGRRVAFVPTMGFLHEGHLRLIDRAGADGAAVVVSIFVNPTQFAPGEDFARYPRDLARDRRLAAERGTEVLFAPSVGEMYPVPDLVTVQPGSLADHLCGPFRPGHFAGVLTVVSKLLHIVEPDVAVFGRKDAQQAQMIRRMVTDLNLPVDIDVAPTVREVDGLALSSRNTYLSVEERRAALALSRALDAAHARFIEGEHAADAVLVAAREVLDAEPGLRVQYVEAVDPETLAPVGVVSADTLIAVAAFAGGTRLIDNVIAGLGTAGDDRLGV